MAESLSRELILPATRLGVPPRPSERQLTALAERSADVWSLSPREWATQQVVRLVVAEALRSRLAASVLPADPEQVTLAQAAHLFGPHVGLARQAFQLAVVEAVNAGVPAATDPLRESLRRVGVTGREPMRMVALGLDRLPTRAASQFWSSARTSSTLTAVVGAIAPDSRDVSGLDRSHLARADALVLAGGRTTAVSLGGRPREGGGSWLPVPVALTRRHRGYADEPRRAGDTGIEVGLRAEGWSEVFEVALDAVGASMLQIDLGSRPKGRASGAAEALAQRLVAAKDRTAVEVVASLRAIDPFVLEMFDHEVTSTDVRVAVPVPEDEPFVQLWMSPSALAGPLVTGSADLFFGGGAEVRSHGGKPPAARGTKKAAGAPPSKEGRRGPRPEGRRGGKGRPGRGPAPQPPTSPPPAPEPPAPPAPPAPQSPVDDASA